MLDPELQKAVDTYFAKGKKTVEQRLEAADKEYHGKWKTMDMSTLLQERDFEIIDFISYSLFIDWRKTHESI